MSRVLDTQEFLDTVCQMLAEGRTNIPIPVAGNSMVPFLHHGDMVFVSTPDSPLKKGDIVLYQRSSGRYILHRIQRLRKDGSLVMVGDAQQEMELLPSQAQVRARVISAIHKGKPCAPKSLRWWLYRHVWLWLRPFRYMLMSLKGKLNTLK
jgi:SOS-response transcriptional repressor LexA